MKPFHLIAVMALCFMGCQKENSLELNDNNNQNTDSSGFDAIVMHYESEGNTYYEDSVIFRYLPARTDEVHYYSPVDSSTKSYHVDGLGKLTEINCPEGIFDPSGTSGSTANATNMKFVYDAVGEIAQIDIEYSNHPPSTSWFTVTQQGGKYHVIMYDTSSSVIEKRIVYYTLNSNRFLELDSTIYIEDTRNYILSHNYTYDGSNNVTQMIQRAFVNGNLASLSTTNYTRHAVANPYVPVREKSYSNLANWFPFTHYYGFNLYNALSAETAGGLIDSYNTDQYIYLASVEHYQYTWQSTLQMKDNKVSKRVSTLTSPGSPTWTFTDKFYYR